MCQTDKLQLLQTVEMIIDTNVFISETGANVDSTGNIQGFINKTKPAKGD